MIYILLAIDFRSEPCLFSEAAGLDLVRGTYGPVISPQEGGRHMTWAKNVGNGTGLRQNQQW